MKKLLSLVLIIAIVFNTSILTFADSGRSTSINDTSKEIFYDGIKYHVEYKNNKTIISADGYDIYFELKENGKAKVSGKDIKDLEKGEEYDLVIRELNSEEIDVDVYKDMKFIENYKKSSKKELDYYDGQALVSVTIVGLWTIFEVLILASMTIVALGLTWYVVSEIVSEIENKTRNDIFPAMLDGNNVFIIRNAITITEAGTRLYSSLSTYSFLQTTAYQAIVATGIGATAPEIHSSSPGTYYWHYHTYLRRGEHAWFGIPTVVN